MRKNDVHVDLKGREVSLAGLDDEERKLVSRLKRRATTHPDWNDFENYWLKAVAGLYEGRGLTRREVTRTVAWRIGQDLGSRLAVEAGLARISDYRDELDLLIHRKFKTRREFCEATGLSEDLVSHVLARRKNISIEKLDQALHRVGYALRIVPQG